MAETEEEKSKKKRGFIIKELVATEKTYVGLLQLVVDVFIQPIRTLKILCVDGGLKGQFLNWESFVFLHKTLLEDLSSADPSEVLVGKFFKLYSHSFKMYKQYLENFDDALTQRALLMCENKKFADLLASAQADPRCNGQGIESFLVTPVQRIPRYRMLLAELLKVTPESHIDHVDLKLSLVEVQIFYGEYS